MHILYYISSHGYGHGVRSSAICNRFSPQVTLTIKTMLPERFFYEELSRPFSYLQGQYDCGCLQTDCITVDIAKTLQTYKSIAENNRKLLDDEVRWCREHRVDCIVTDIASFPCEVARKASIPSVAVSNFSWYDIYAPYCSANPSFNPFLEEMCTQYRMAHLLCALDPSNDMACFSTRKEIPLICRSGVRRTDEIKRRYLIDENKKLGLIYTGNFGMHSVRWKMLEQFDKWEFVGVYPLPGNPRNYHLIKKADFRFIDLTASVDLMISKIGYGVYTECLGNGVPLLYVPRTDFAEHPVLEKAIQQWGHGYRLEHDSFSVVDWEGVLKSIVERTPPEKIISDGALQCASEIELITKEKSLPSHFNRRE